METWSGPLIGLSGVIVGIVINEYLRRGRRVEQYSTLVFSKRLEIYEKLMALVHEGSTIASEVIANETLSREDRHSMISGAIVSIANFVDSNPLYLNEELAAHCTALFMGAEDIYDAVEPQKTQLLESYYKMRRETVRMIRADAGVAQIDKLFRSINRPRITSPVIERIRELRREK
jgi:hypothetical protein